MANLKSIHIHRWMQKNFTSKRVIVIIMLFYILNSLQERFLSKFEDDDDYWNWDEGDKRKSHARAAAKLETPIALFENPEIEQDDPHLLKHIKDKRLTPPPVVRNTSNVHDASEWQEEIRQIFRGGRHGFYIECGANDGEYLSNTYYLDKKYDWSGLLIEANSYLLKDLYSSGRNAWISDACLSTTAYPQKVEFLHRLGDVEWYKGNGMLQASGDRDNPTYPPETHNYVSAGMAECFPLYSILAALGVTTVDYFSLDVEGVEYKVLKNIPFDKVTIKVISVEFNLIPEGKPALMKLFADNGYEVLIETYRELFMVLSRYKHEFGRRRKRSKNGLGNTKLKML